MRLTGQDSRRGTFNQRHAALIDIENGRGVRPARTCCGRSRRGSKFTIRRFPKPRCWDSNTVSAAIFPRRWCCGKRNSAISRTARRSSSTNSSRRARTSGICSPGVVLLLPHGYEGQGPEHSSARIERFLAARRARQHSDLPALHRRAVFSSAAAAGAAPVAQAAGRVHAEEHAAQSSGVFVRSLTWQRPDSNV